MDASTQTDPYKRNVSQKQRDALTLGREKRTENLRVYAEWKAGKIIENAEPRPVATPSDPQTETKKVPPSVEVAKATMRMIVAETDPRTIELEMPRFSVDAAYPGVPSPLPNQAMFSLFVGPPRSGKTSLSTALLTTSKPQKVYNGIFNDVYLIVPQASFESMVDSPFKKLDKSKVIHEFNPESLAVIRPEKREPAEIARAPGCQPKAFAVFGLGHLTDLPSRPTIYTKDAIELESLREELVARDKAEFALMFQHVFPPSSDSHAFMFIDVASGEIYSQFQRLIMKSDQDPILEGPDHQFMSIGNLPREGLMNYAEHDPRNKATYFTLNGAPYAGPYNRNFETNSYYTGVRLSLYSEKLKLLTKAVEVGDEDAFVEPIDKLARVPRRLEEYFVGDANLEVLAGLKNNSLENPLESVAGMVARTIAPFNADTRTPERQGLNLSAFTDNLSSTITKAIVAGFPPSPLDPNAPPAADEPVPEVPAPLFNLSTDPPIAPTRSQVVSEKKSALRRASAIAKARAPDPPPAIEAPPSTQPAQSTPVSSSSGRVRGDAGPSTDSPHLGGSPQIFSYQYPAEILSAKQQVADYALLVWHPSNDKQLAFLNSREGRTLAGVIFEKSADVGASAADIKANLEQFMHVRKEISVPSLINITSTNTDEQYLS
ncbi:hypothetical protein T492DRAFT_841892 [Pavlovales sp. CCMP2436]|nr:hypothetical protein T492DRAFT_841892 [Pavlovales sp. CCMP2436]